MNINIKKYVVDIQKEVISVTSKKKNWIKKTNILSIIFTAFLLLGFISLSASAAVSNLKITPETPVVGDNLKISGTASPDEKIDLKVSFKKEIPVLNGQYRFELEDVKIPDGLNNHFTVRAKGVEDLNVRVKIGVWITRSTKASSGTAIISQSRIPKGTYDIKISGNAAAGTSSVELEITAQQEIEAESDGKFSYSYNTKPIPPSNFKVSVGGESQELTLSERKPKPGSQSESKTQPKTQTKLLEEPHVEALNISENQTEEENQTLGRDIRLGQYPNISENQNEGENSISNVNSVKRGISENLSGEFPASSKEKASEKLPAKWLYILGGIAGCIFILLLYVRSKHT
ncbi:MAG: hypothetical protein PHG90_06290 [Clostridia bacterium]|nr:hypothetical protein [Clostridia bacterium]